MSITTDSEVLAYIQINEKCLTPSMRGLVTRVRNKAENLVREYVGYEVESATVVEYFPQKTIPIRAEGDGTSAGFEMVAGLVVPRQTFPTYRRELALTQLPVRSITSVYDNPAAYNVAGGEWPEGSLLPTNSYYLDRDIEGAPVWSGILFRNVGSWSTSPRSIRVTYVAGLTAAELHPVTGRYTEYAHAVQVTCAKMLADIAARSNMARTGQGATSSVSVEDFAASFAGQNSGMIGSFLGTGVGSAAMPTEAMQVLAHRVSMAKYF